MEFLLKFWKRVGEAITPYLVRILEISFNNVTISSHWKIATVISIYKVSYWYAFSKYRPISLISVVCKQLEYIIAGYLSQIWVKNDGLYES